MDSNKLNGLILLIVGLYSAIRFRYNGRVSLEQRLKLLKLLSFNKLKREPGKHDVIHAQILYLVGGIIFIIIGLAKLFNL